MAKELLPLYDQDSTVDYLHYGFYRVILIKNLGSFVDYILRELHVFIHFRVSILLSSKRGQDWVGISVRIFSQEVPRLSVIVDMAINHGLR